MDNQVEKEARESGHFTSWSFLRGNIGADPVEELPVLVVAYPDTVKDT